MKTFLFIVAGALVFFSCKKDGGSGKKMMLSKVFIDNLLSEEYIYSADKKPLRRNSYSTSLGQSTFAGFRLYGYTNGQLTEKLQYNKFNQLSAKHVLSYNASNQLSRIDAYGADDEIDLYFLFEYGADQQISQINTYSVAPVKKSGELLLEYDPDGNLLSFKRYYLSGTWILFDSTTFTAADRSLPDHWDYYEMYPLDFPVEKTFLQMPAASMHYYLAGGPPSKSNHTYSNKVYNSAGYLTSQHYKLEADNAITITTFDYELRYEYVE